MQVKVVDPSKIHSHNNSFSSYTPTNESGIRILPPVCFYCGVCVGIVQVKIPRSVLVWQLYKYTRFSCSCVVNRAQVVSNKQHPRSILESTRRILAKCKDQRRTCRARKKEAEKASRAQGWTQELREFQICAYPLLKGKRANAPTPF
jgi:hypothetical protein